MKINERVLSDDYPVHCGYTYVCDGRIRIAPTGDITVKELKRLLGVSEVKNCDLVGRELFY